MTTPTPQPARPHLAGLTPERLGALVERHGGRPVHATRLLRALHREVPSDLQGLARPLGKRLVARLSAAARLGWPEIAEQARSEDGTTRFRLRLADGASVEAVDIPDGRRTTLCISSQVGCALRCSFCCTGTFGLTRNLEAAEIAGQVAVLRRGIEDAGRELTNVVLMGMGEPLLNYDAVSAALHILLHDSGGGLPGRRLTVSTAGVPAGITRLGAEFGGSVALAVSLSGSSDTDRDRLMPINRRFPLQRLIQACREYPLPRQRSVAFEVVLLAGETDRNEDAARLVALLDGVAAKVNLIPFNPFPGAPHAAPDAAAVDRFFRLLNGAGLRCTIRKARGQEVAAACGLLASGVRG